MAHNAARAAQENEPGDDPAVTYKSEEMFRALFQSSPDAICVTTPANSFIIDANDAFESLFGYSKAELMGSSTFGLKLWVNLEEREKIRGELEAQDRVSGCPVRLRKKSGEVFPAMLSIGKLTVRGSVVTIATVRDLTVMSQAEERLRESEARFRAISENALVGTYITRGNIITYVNPALASMFGYTPNELVGCSPFILVEPEDLAMVTENIRRRIAGEIDSLQYEFRGRRKDGSVLYLEAHGTRIDLAGQPAIIGNILDVTERKLAEQELRERSHLLENILEHAPIGFAVHRVSDGKVTFVGRRYEEIYGIAPGTLQSVPQFWEEAFPDPVERQRIQSFVFPDMESGDVTRMRWEKVLQTTRSGARKYLTAVNIPLPELGLMVSTVQDVTAQAALEAQLRQAQKLECLGRLAGGVAHDFNNLLTVINGYSGIIEEKLGRGDELYPMVSRISEAGRLAAGLTSQLLAFSRKQVFAPRVLDLNAQIQKHSQMIGRVIGEDVEIELKLDDSIGKVLADPDQIYQVIMNLAVNARDAMPLGGRIEIASLEGAADPAVKAEQRQAGVQRYAAIRITDSGVGMTPDILEHIFEPFYTTKAEGRGTGLGLSVVHGIVSQFGGWVEVRSEPGVGSSFTVHLPVIAAEVPSTKSGVPGSSVTNKGECILVVEDQAEFRELIGEILAGLGYKILVAANAEEAISIAASANLNIHLLLTDVILPGMNGVALAGQIRQLRPELKVLFMSGYTADALTQSGVLEQGIHSLRKPFAPDEITKRITDVLADSNIGQLGRKL